MRLQQLVFVPDPPSGDAAAEEMCEKRFDRDQCGTKKIEENINKDNLLIQGVKQGGTLSPNITEIVSL